MIELKIPEIILRERRKKNLTQEELADALGVSPQAVSNWERGGYPDITLLPCLANFFWITVDELIGNDVVAQEADIENFKEQYRNATYSSPEALRLAKEYHQKYPSDFDIAERLIFAIHHNRETREENYPLLKGVCEKILRECTFEYVRQNAIEFMCADCPDEEWENWRDKCPQFYFSQANEVLEERHWQRHQGEEYLRQSKANTLLILLHFLGREYMRYFDKENDLLFREPKKTAALMHYRMRVVEAISEDGNIPEAWSGVYADLSLKYAAALIGAGAFDRGFSALEYAFERYKLWLKIPKGKRMEVGSPAVFGGAQIIKCEHSHVVNIYMPDGTVIWCPYLWLFWQLPNDIERAMSNWPWFDCARGDPRYLTLYEKAKRLAGWQS